jgi:DDE superfamily endonuclease
VTGRTGRTTLEDAIRRQTPETRIAKGDRDLRRELGPVIPRSFPPAPGWTPDGHRVKAPPDYGRGPEKTWVYGAMRVRDGTTVTLTAPSRNSVGYQRLLTTVETANPAGAIVVITDNLSSHTSLSTRTWLADHPRIQHTFIPKRACWLNLQEGWWRLFRREAFAGQSFATPEEITLATRSRPASSTPLPARGCGAGHPRPHGADAASSPTGFSERSTILLSFVG